MNKLTIITLFCFAFFSCRKGKDLEPVFYKCDFNFTDSSALSPDNSKYNALLNSITSSGVPGIMMAVYHPQTGMWMGASGKADLHNNVNMQPCNITRVGSTVKMFTAATILKLKEEGKIALDNKLSDYIQGDVITKIKNAEKVTVRQLLQHSSGIYNYIQNLNFQTASINNLIKEWKPEELLKYAYNKSPYFQPDEDVAYSNTNYILLGMLIEKIEGKPFYKVFEEKLFAPLGLTMTKFAAEDHVPDGIIRGYIDLYSNLNVIESTYYSGWDYYTADGGLISNPYDLNRFFQALMNGMVINPISLSEMLTWRSPKIKDPAFFDIEYGLGIFKIHTHKGIAYMHSGDAIGYYANMLYFPADSSTITYATNGNYGKIDQFTSTKEAMVNIISETK